MLLMIQACKDLKWNIRIRKNNNLIQRNKFYLAILFNFDFSHETVLWYGLLVEEAR